MIMRWKAYNQPLVSARKLHGLSPPRDMRNKGLRNKGLNKGRLCAAAAATA
jgi:hypothetical protein